MFAQIRTDSARQHVSTFSQNESTLSNDLCVEAQSVEGRLFGRWVDYRSYLVVATYHRQREAYKQALEKPL